METWRDIEGYEGLYQVSNLGRVKSLARKGRLKERILKAAINGRGYQVVNLYKNSVIKTLSVHQLVAVAFLNHKPCGMEIVIDHIDNDKLNNHVDNLQLITNRHNLSKDKKGGSSKHVGVSWFKGTKKWMVRIDVNGRQEYLGTFANELDAAKAYQDKLKEIEYANV